MTLNSGLGTQVLKVWFSEGKKKERERIGVKKDNQPQQKILSVYVESGDSTGCPDTLKNKDIYLFGCTRSQLWQVSSFVAARGI